MRNFNSEIFIDKTRISRNDPTYFIADIGANHDGDIERAKDLIFLAKEAGANAAKFQHFVAEKIVNDVGFKNLGNKQSHQAQWKRSVFDTYKFYEAKKIWTQELIEACKKADITFLTTPYDFEAIEEFESLLPAFKIGSGDITWIEFIQKIAQYQKPILLATGAASLEDVERAVNAINSMNRNLVIMQCNTNYTGSLGNFKYINLNVLKTYANKWPNAIFGLSDHTLGHTTVLGGVALGARVVEKHFTDDNSREGPDHFFAMTPTTWKDMIGATRELEYALGDGIKRVEDNEKETCILQRRSISIKVSLKRGDILQYDHLDFLRPAPLGSLAPFEFEKITGKKLLCDVEKGTFLSMKDLE